MNKELLRESPIVEDLHIEHITEEEDNGEKILKIKGTGSRADVFNRNNRRYPKEVLTKAVEKVQPLVDQGKFVGLLDHPGFLDSGDLKNTAIKFNRLWMDNTMLRFEGNVIPTSAGKELSSLLRAKVGIGMSTRGYGTVKPVEGAEGKYDIQDDYELAGIDAVLNESNQYAKISKFENKEGGKNVELTLDKLKEEHPELVEQLKKEFSEELNSDFEDKITKAVDDYVKEHAEEIVKESDEFKSQEYVINTIIEAVKPFIPGQEEYEDAEKQKQIDTLQAEVDGLKKDLEAAKEESTALKAEKELEEAKKEVAEHIGEKVKNHRFAEQLRDRLKDCTSVEDVDSKFESEVKFIESLLTNATEPKGEGFVNNNPEDDSTQTGLDEQKKREQKLAGINTEKGGK